MLHAIQTTNKELLNHILELLTPNLSIYMETVLTSLKKYLPYIENMMRSNYTNGILEEIKNKIKVIKRIAFSYKSFYHFKARILIIQTQSILNKKHKKRHPLTA
ncbi:MAG: transposase [Turicibacter sp.]